MNVARCFCFPTFWVLLFSCSLLLSGQTPDRTKAAQEWVTQTQSRLNLPGFSVAVGQAGKLVFEYQAGMANLEHQVPVTPRTLFRMGSVSKLFTIALGAQLAQDGLLQWEDPVSKYHAQAPAKERPPTLAELASHTGGVRHYRFNDFRDCDRLLKAVASDTLMYSSLEDGLSIFITDPLLFEPGQGYSYTSYGYNLLGVALEKAGNGAFLELLKQKVLVPLQMSQTQADHPYQVVPHRASGYTLSPQNTWLSTGLTDSSYKWPSGGLLGTPHELVVFGSVFLGPGYFSEETLKKIFTPQPNARNQDFQVGLGWRMGTTAQGSPVYHHGGAIEGGRTFLLLLPNTKTVVALMTNTLANVGYQEALELAGFFP